MSDPSARVPTVFHPWRRLRHLSHITVQKEAEPELLGSWCARSRVIRLHPALSQAERRCTLTHELIHAELGHIGECDERTDQLVHREAARRLIPIRDLADAVLFYEDDLDGMAEHLWVDHDTLKTRLDHLHPAERGLLKRALAMKEQTA